MKQLRIAAAAFLACALSVPAGAQPADGTSFVDAVRKSDGSRVNQLLAERPLGLIDSRDEKGDTGLLIAIARRDEQWTGFLLNKGANTNLGGMDGNTPLILAARVGFDEAIAWLLALKAKVDADNRMGETPLMIAVQQHRLPIVRTLLAAGADPDKTDFTGYSARDYARRDPRARDILKMIDTARPKVAVKP